ncbi:MAG: hypothetical protein V4677_14325 [Bacteroidota bacterium]
MKKITLLAAVLVAVSFASCKKEAKCECTTTLSGVTSNGVPQNLGSYTETTVTTKEISKTSKKNAAAMCGNEATTTTQHDSSGDDIYTYSTACSIK